MTDIDTAAEKVVTLLKQRNAAYGDRNLLDYGILGLVVRISDKLGRIKTAMAKHGDGADVKAIIEDALMDIAGYAINGLRLLENGQMTLLGKAMEGYMITELGIQLDDDCIIKPSDVG